MVKLKPLRDRIVVRRSKASDSKGKILLPDSAQEKPREGLVIAVGPGKRNEEGQINPLCIKVNDRVLFGAYAGTEFKHDDEEYLILLEDDVLGILS